MEEQKRIPRGMPHCEKCKQSYDTELSIPLMLPCGETYCKACIVQEIQGSGRVSCIEEGCRQQHLQVSVQQLVQNKRLLKLMQQLGTNKPKFTCIDHPQEALKFYCVPLDKLYCTLC